MNTAEHPWIGWYVVRKKLIKVIGGVLLVAAILFGGAIAVGRLLSDVAPVEQSRNSRSTEIIASVTRTQEVVLLSLGIQGITEDSAATTVLGVQVPGSGRNLFLQYNYRAKLGISGAKVQIEQTGDNSFTITIPEFVFLGYDNVSFRKAVESNGLLSFVTPEIDEAEVITSILDDAKKNQHITDNEATLQDQARSFYTGIISAVDPEAKLTFKFGGKSR